MLGITVFILYLFPILNISLLSKLFAATPPTIEILFTLNFFKAFSTLLVSERIAVDWNEEAISNIADSGIFPFGNSFWVYRKTAVFKPLKEKSKSFLVFEMGNFIELQSHFFEYSSIFGRPG